MIALLLASHLVGIAPANPPPQNFVTPAPARASELIRQLPHQAACKNDLGRLEASYATPAAVYRNGDRPGKVLKKWVDYPDGQICSVEAAK
jgi:hypothetical protein